jgi:hypothetical protein
LFLFQGVRAIESIALGGDEAGVGDDAAKFAFVGAVANAGGIHNIFFDQNTADVVRTELQTDLADFYSGSEPAGLNVIDVVEIEAADGERFQIIDSGSFLNFFSEWRVVGRENPRNESGEAAGVFLNAANALEVIDAVAQLFAAAEHHGGSSTQAELVRGAMHIFPIIAGAFEARDLGADFIIKNFCAAAGDRLQAGVHQSANGVFDAQFADFSDAKNFRRGKTVQMNSGIALLDGAEKIFVVIDLQIGMQAALKQNAVAAELEHLLDLLENFLEAEDVAVFCANGAVESAERAILGAEICVINVAVDLVGGDARVVLFQADLVSGHADADEVIGFEHVEGLLFGQCHVGSKSSLIAAGRAVRRTDSLPDPAARLANRPNRKI